MGMNLFVLFTISLPEAFLNLIIIMLVAGKKGNLAVNKKNVVRFVITLALMLACSWVIRNHLAHSVFGSFVYHSIAYVLILMLVYRFNLQTAILSDFFMLFFFATFENVLYPNIIAIFFKTLDNYYNQPIYIRLLVSLTPRCAQILMITLLWKHEHIFMVSKINRKLHNYFCALLVIMMAAQDYFSVMFVEYYQYMSTLHRALYSITLLLMIVTVYFIVYQILYIGVKGVVTNGYVQYQELEEGAHEALTRVSALLENSRVDDAKVFLNQLLEDDDGNKKG